MDGKDIIQSVVYILAIDGKIDAQEYQYLKNLCHHLNVPDTVLAELLDQVKQGRGGVKIPEAAAEKVELFSFLVQAAYSDGKLEPSEQKALQALAVKIKLSAEQVKQIVATHRPKAVNNPAVNMNAQPVVIVQPPSPGNVEINRTSPMPLNPDEMYCRNCRNRISKKAVVCVNCGVPPLLERKYCPACGATTTEKQVICTQCGIAFPAEPPQPSSGNAAPQASPVPSQTEEQKKKDESGAFCGGAICMCIIIIILAYFFGKQ